MGFKMKEKHQVFGVDATSTFGVPVFEKKLDDGIMAEANRDGTIFVDKSLSPLQKKDAVEHEKVHLEQMQQGQLQYDDYTVTWKKDTKSPPRVYERANMNEGHPDFEWESEAYANNK